MRDQTDLHKRAKPLMQRIDLQKKYGTRDLADWFLKLAAPRPADTVLDIGCGSGKDLIAFAQVCSRAVGIDISRELLKAAREAVDSLNLNNVRLVEVPGDSFDLGEERFSIIMCNFAIYYLDVEETIKRMARCLTPAGTAYIMGSPDENARELMQIHGQATDFLPDVYAPGYSDIHKYQSLMRKYFRECLFHRFLNPVNFPGPDEFTSYYTSTTLFQRTHEVDENIEAKIAEISRRVFEEKGVITITKVVDTAVLKEPVADA
jgi:ubiquinone/menaquinone biosynthesis C-methylase UbiE